MKQRIISAIVALMMLLPIILVGGTIFSIATYVIALLGLKELLAIKETRKELPHFIKFISYILLTLIIFGNANNGVAVLSIDLRIIAGLFLMLLVPVIFYHDFTKYSINDAFFLVGSIFFLGVSFGLLITVRNESLLLLLYLLLITTITDTYAYITGFLIGKYKLLENISPKKTLEGLIGGTIFGVYISVTYYHVLIDANIPIFHLIFMTTFLSVVGQIGDLFFSSVKRYYGKKDFSNIMPGHGGVLDRLDSIIFVLLAFIFFITII